MFSVTNGMFGVSEYMVVSESEKEKPNVMPYCVLPGGNSIRLRNLENDTPTRDTQDTFGSDDDDNVIQHA